MKMLKSCGDVILPCTTPVMKVIVALSSSFGASLTVAPSYICSNKSAGSAHALVPVCKVCSFVLGDKDGGVQLVYVERSSFGEGAYF